MEHLVYIAYGYSMDEEINMILKNIGVKGLTKWREIAGEGNSDPHLGTDVWPLKNNMVMIACDNDLKNKLAEAVKSLRGKYAESGITMFVSPLTEVV